MAQLVHQGFEKLDVSSPVLELGFELRKTEIQEGSAHKNYPAAPEVAFEVVFSTAAGVYEVLPRARNVCERDLTAQAFSRPEGTQEGLAGRAIGMAIAGALVMAGVGVALLYLDPFGNLTRQFD